MPITARIVNKVLTLTWASEDQTTEASFRIPPEATDVETLKLLRKAVNFMEVQMGMNASPPANVPFIDLTHGSTKETASATTATPSATTPGGILLPMMNPGALSDRPSDGGPPRGNMDQKFWESMPTLSVPDNLASQQGGGWEMMPPEDGGSW